MRAVLNFFNRYELLLLGFWLLTIVVFEFTILPLSPLLIVLSSLLALGFTIQGRFGTIILKDKSTLVRLFPSIFGNSSAVSILGALFMIHHWPGANVMLYIGLIGIGCSTFLLFYTPVQDEFLPVMKKFLFRIFTLVIIAISISFY